MWRIGWAVVLAACSVGSDAGGRDAGGGRGGALDAASDAPGPMWIDAMPGAGSGSNDCRPPATGYGDGRHNTGRNCMDACHEHGFTLAGTVYTSPTNNTGYAGATITVKDANDVTYEIVVQANGNFWTSQPIAFPAVVMASSCPYEAKMNGPITNGACNTAACHAQQDGAAGQIHLP